MDGGAWWAAVHGVTRSWTQLSDFMFAFHFHALEKEMATHSRVLAWSIPGMGEPGGLPSMGSHRVGHNWSDLAAAAATEILKGNTEGQQELCSVSEIRLSQQQLGGGPNKGGQGVGTRPSMEANTIQEFPSRRQQAETQPYKRPGSHQ